MIETNKAKLNRRLAFRIYQRANLFYHKIDRNLSIQNSPDREPVALITRASQRQTEIGGISDDPSFEAMLPASESLENDTLNVNIGAGGIAFTCKEKLQAGDYLQARILLLSNMTKITTCCKVVFCKSSNPYENDRYPYLIGARFVNLAAADQDLLNSYLEKCRRQQFVLNGLLLLAIIAFLAMPDQAWDLTLALGHYLLEGTLHLLHVLFEYLEFALDHVVEHLFHTGLHQTQVIVFYILLAFASAGLYWLWRIVPPACRRFFQTLCGYYSRKRASLLYSWGEQTLGAKIGILLLGIVLTVCYGYFGI